MPARTRWSREELLVAFALYCRIPFGRLHHQNPDIVRMARAIGRTPSALAMKLSNIAGLDPAVTATGRLGLANASAGDRAMWSEMQGDWDGFVLESQRALAAAELGLEGGAGRPREAADPEQRPATEDDGRVGRDRLALASTRVGQDFFRRAVLSAYDEKCCVTGLGVPRLLVASHIVPWRHDPANRLNPRNGLALSVLHDRAFDTGLVTVRADLTLQLSPRAADLDDPFFNAAVRAFEGRRIAVPDKFAPNPEFLAYHREHVFQH